MGIPSTRRTLGIVLGVVGLMWAASIWFEAAKQEYFKDQEKLFEQGVYAAIELDERPRGDTVSLFSTIGDPTLFDMTEVRISIHLVGDKWRGLFDVTSLDKTGPHRVQASVSENTKIRVITSGPDAQNREFMVRQATTEPFTWRRKTRCDRSSGTTRH